MMPIKQFFDKLKKLLFGKVEVEEKPKEEKAEYYVPLTAETIERIPEWALKEIHSLRAYAKRLEEEVERLKEELKRTKGIIEEEELREIERLYKLIKEKEAQNCFYIILKTERPIEIESFEGRPFMFVTKDNRIDELGHLVAMKIEQTDHGPYVYLICRGRYTDDYGILPLGFLSELPYVIYDFDNLIFHLKRGRLTIYKDAFGRRVPYYVTYTQASSESSSSKEKDADPPAERPLIIEKYKDLLNQYPELRDALIDLYNKYQQAISEKAELESELEKLKEENMVLKAKNEASKSQMLMNRIHTVKAIAELGESYKALTDAITENIQLKQRIVPLEAGYEDLILKVEELIRRYHEDVSKLPKEFKEEVKEAVSEAIEELPWDIIERGIKRLRGKAETETKEETK